MRRIIVDWTERVGRPLLAYSATYHGRGRRRSQRIAGAVGSWVLWGGYRQLRQRPVGYLLDIVHRSLQRVAVRWYPSVSDDWEDCEACGITNDICVYHQGVNACAGYVEGKVSSELASTLFPER